MEERTKSVVTLTLKVALLKKGKTNFRTEKDEG
jgi:hypothetical protein